MYARALHFSEKFAYKNFSSINNQKKQNLTGTAEIVLCLSPIPMPLSSLYDLHVLHFKSCNKCQQNCTIINDQF